jgi:hypothetical protein
MGEAAGVAAAIATDQSSTVRRVSIQDIKKQLHARGAITEAIT